MPAVTVKEIKDIVGGTLIGGDEDIVINAYSTDSRKAGANTLFVPVIGENVDAHDFMSDAYKNGCRASFTSRQDTSCIPEGMTCIKVDNNVHALQLLGKTIRERYTLPVVGITGSVGKTTTKEMIAAALSTEKEVLKTYGNMNSQVSLPQMMMCLEDKYEIAVIEMGMSQVGEMERIVQVAQPETAVFTNIGLSHIGQLGSKENILKEKLRILDCMPEDGLVLVNGDDELLSKLPSGYSSNIYPETKEALKKVKIKSYGTSEKCTYRAENIRLEGEHASFIYRGVPVDLNVGGMHNVLNALAALAIAEKYSVSLPSAIKGLADYKPAHMRGEIKRVGNFTLMDDTYNASPDSMQAALDIFSRIKAARHIAVLADILELGSISEECHKNVGKMVSEKDIDILFTIGNEARAIAAMAKEIGRVKMIKSFSSNDDAYIALKDILTEDDAVLIKGSRGMQLEQISTRLQKDAEV